MTIFQRWKEVRPHLVAKGYGREALDIDRKIEEYERTDDPKEMLDLISILQKVLEEQQWPTLTQRLQIYSARRHLKRARQLYEDQMRESD